MNSLMCTYIPSFDCSKIEIAKLTIDFFFLKQKMLKNAGQKFKFYIAFFFIDLIILLNLW